jgi:hypothetical protein
VEVGTDGTLDATPFVAVLAVVPKAGDHSSERLGAGIQVGPARVILEPGQGSTRPSLELAFEEDVADHAPVAGHGRVGEEPRAGKLDAGAIPVKPSEQLVAAAYGEQCRPAGDRFDERRALVREISCDQALLPILPAADVEEVDVGWDSIVNTDGAHLESDGTPGTAPFEDGDVATIRIDVEVVRVEVSDHQVPETSHA